jgi:microcystin-dependent protein
MPETYKTVLTTVGAAKIANALSEDTAVEVSDMAIGDGNGNATIPSDTQTALVREVYRAAINSSYAANNDPRQMVFELVIPSSVGGWTVREVGLFDAEGALIAVANIPNTYKPIISEGSTRDLIIRIILSVDNPEALVLIADPNVSIATRAWVSANFSIVQLLPGGTTSQILGKASNADGDFQWIDPVTGFTILVDVIQESQTLSAAQTVVSLATATTENAAFYVEGLRLHPSEFTIDSDTQITLATPAAGAEKFLAVQNDPLSAPEYLKPEQNLADVANVPAARANLGINTQAEIIIAVLSILYPVGEILITRRSGTPDTWLGFGTWEAYGPGRTLVGYDGGDADFDNIDETGGEKAHVLSASEMPQHSHTIPEQILNTDIAGNHSHSIAKLIEGVELGAEGEAFAEAGNDGSTNETSELAGNHQHSLTVPEQTTSSEGGSAAHNNLPPYIVVYFWKRTA